MKTPQKLLVLSVFIICLNPSIVEAEDEDEGEKFSDKLVRNDPNYFAWVTGDSNDTDHLEFYLSLKYPLFWFSESKDTTLGKISFIFIYNGKYDFYITSRKSSPVISRLQNPGLAFELNLDELDPVDNYFRAGWYHESNGQSIETLEEFQAADHAIDSVSRGWDYLGIDYKRSMHGWGYDLNLRLYCDCEAFGFINERKDKIFWKDVETQPTIWDFDGFRAGIEYYPTKWIPNIHFRADVKTGLNGLDALGNISAELSLRFNIKFRMMGIDANLPFTIFYFNGYGKNISTYNNRDQYIGIGFVFR